MSGRRAKAIRRGEGLSEPEARYLARQYRIALEISHATLTAELVREKKREARARRRAGSRFGRTGAVERAIMPKRPTKEIQRRRRQKKIDRARG